MAVRTHVDQIINYTSKIITTLSNSPEVIGFLINNPHPDVDGADGDLARSRIFDFNFIDETNIESVGYIMVTTEMIAQPTWTIKDLMVNIEVLMSKTYIPLDNKLFKGVRGNRLDNIIRQIDLLINGNRDFGVGRLTLTGINCVKAPAAFSAKVISYYCPDFARDRELDQ